MEVEPARGRRRLESGWSRKAWASSAPNFRHVSRDNERQPSQQTPPRRGENALPLEQVAPDLAAAVERGRTKYGKVPERSIGARWKRDGRQRRHPSSNLGLSARNPWIAQLAEQPTDNRQTFVRSGVQGPSSRWCSGSTRVSKSLGGSSILSRDATFSTEGCRSWSNGAASKADGPKGRERSNRSPSAIINLAVAQMEERRATNAEAMGSNPIGEAKFWKVAREVMERIANPSSRKGRAGSSPAPSAMRK